MYGLKQASRAWYERVHGYLVSIGFQRTIDKNCLYIKEGPWSKTHWVDLFVDGILFSRHDNLCKDFYEAMSKEFETRHQFVCWCTHSSNEGY